VIESRHADFKPGDRVVGAWGWQDYAATDGSGLVPAAKIPAGVEFPTALSLFGITGLTAYFGLLDLAAPRAGDVVVVSAAAGSTGSFVAQIAKLKGCQVIGIAGGEEKCVFLTKDLGLDGAIDHRRQDVSARLRELCPNGIDVYFDNVGGDMLDAALGNLAAGARVVVCGAISGYNDLAHMPPIHNYLNLVLAGATMRGFLVFSFAPRFEEAITQLAGWAAAGQIKIRVDIIEGLARAPEALRRLFTGDNIGKQLVKIADAP
jgi:NADPH-dependent curcumin reductase